MSKSKAENTKGTKSSSAQPKVYRSMTEIRRAFYPKASQEKSAAKGSTRAKNAILGVKTRAQ